MEKLPRDIIYEIFNHTEFTLNSLMYMFLIDKKINEFMKNKCNELKLYNLFMCTNKCKFFESSNCNHFTIEEKIGNNGRKYNRIYVKKNALKECKFHNTDWRCCVCQKNIKRSIIECVDITPCPYNTHTDNYSYDTRKVTKFIERNSEYMVKDIKSVGICKYTSYTIKKDYYFWKGCILKGIQNIQCIQCKNRTFEAMCSSCNKHFYSEYFGKKPQLCDECLV